MRPGTLAAGAGVAVGGGLAALAYARLECEAYTLRRFEIPVLPVGAAPIRVLHLSDMHLTPSDTRRVEWVRGLAALEPDLVVDTGDNLAHLQAVPTALDALGPLLDLPGVFVHGSNDYFSPRPRNPLVYFGGPTRRHGKNPLPTGELTSALTDAGWLDLNNCRGALTVAGRAIRFVGVDDPHIERDCFPDPEPVPAAGSGTEALRIGVVHAPYLRVLDPMVDEGCDVVLAGHTHGGQVCLPFWGALVTNCDLPTRYAKGLNVWETGTAASWLHVSAGLGSNPYARIRFACRPEASLLTLVPEAPDQPW